MTKLTKFAALAVALVLTSTVARGEDKIENPTFKGWSKFKAGTTVALKINSESDGKKYESTVTNKLIEVTNDKLVLETEGISKINGQDVKVPTQKQDVTKLLEKAPIGFDAKTGKPDGTTEEGKEKVKIGDTEYECKWYKYKTKQNTTEGDGVTENQVWMSDDVPGTFVKLISKWKSGTMTMEAADINVKK